jgi:hypothetical protein
MALSGGFRSDQPRPAFDAVDGSSNRHVSATDVALLRLPRFGGAIHANGHDLGLEIAKSVFQVDGVDAPASC